MARLGRRLLAAVLGLAASGPGQAADAPPAGFVQAARALYSGGGPADGDPQDGFSAALRLPLGERWFLTGSARRLDPYDNFIGMERPAESHYALGVGAREVTSTGERFAQLRYMEVRDWRSSGLPQERARGGTLTYGGRKMLLPYLEFWLEGGLGWLGGREEHQLFFAGEADLALMLLPSVWAYAGYAIEDSAVANLGLRVTFGPERARTQGQRRYAAGQSLVAASSLQLQVRPAFGAPETTLIPAGTEVALLEETRNEFGTWWRVRAGEQEGWIREGHLK